MLSVFAADCNAIDLSVTTRRDETEHGNDAEPNFIFIVILAKACYGFWRLFLLRLYFFAVVHVACSSSATPLRSSTGSRTDSRSVHAASPLVRRSYRELRRAQNLLSRHSRQVHLSVAYQQIAAPSSTPTHCTPTPPPALFPTARRGTLVYFDMRLWHIGQVGGFRVFLLYRGLTFL